MVQAGGPVGLAGAAARVPGQHPETFFQQHARQSQDVPAAAMAFQTVRQNGHPAFRQARRGRVDIHIQKIPVRRIQTYPSAAGGLCRIGKVQTAAFGGPDGVDMGIAQPERRAVAAGQYWHDGRPRVRTVGCKQTFILDLSERPCQTPLPGKRTSSSWGQVRRALCAPAKPRPTAWTWSCWNVPPPPAASCASAAAARPTSPTAVWRPITMPAPIPPSASPHWMPSLRRTWSAWCTAGACPWKNAPTASCS